MGEAKVPMVQAAVHVTKWLPTTEITNPNCLVHFIVKTRLSF